MPQPQTLPGSVQELDSKHRGGDPFASDHFTVETHICRLEEMAESRAQVSDTKNNVYVVRSIFNAGQVKIDGFCNDLYHHPLFFWHIYIYTYT